MGNTTIALSQVDITFHLKEATYTAVSGVDLEVDSGRFVAIIGPTGCGKTTVLNAIAGLITPSAGLVRVDGIPLSGLNKSASYMFQQDSLLPWLNVRDNIALGLAIRGMKRRDRNICAADWANRVGLAQFMNAYPYQLSGGMRKRASMAQVWIVDPEILLMDEPFGALDVQTRLLMQNELLRLWTGSSKTVVFVTHDLDEAIALSDEVLLLSAGPASTVVGRYQIPLPRPRDILELRALPEFREIHGRIWSDLQKEVLTTYERDPARPA
jgi:NitT/TauT family transport system ATP-binding protein